MSSLWTPISMCKSLPSAHSLGSWFLTWAVGDVLQLLICSSVVMASTEEEIAGDPVLTQWGWKRASCWIKCRKQNRLRDIQDMNLYLSTGIPVIGMVKTSDSPSSSVSNVYFYRCHEVGGGSELMVRVVPTPATGALVYLCCSTDHLHSQAQCGNFSLAWAGKLESGRCVGMGDWANCSKK